MKRRTILSRLGFLTEADDVGRKQRQAISELLEKLSKKEKALRKELEDEKSESGRRKLKAKLKACKAQRKKGEALLEDS